MKIIIEVPDNTKAVSFTCISEDEEGFVMRTKMMGSKDLERFKDVESDM